MKRAKQIIPMTSGLDIPITVYFSFYLHPVVVVVVLILLLGWMNSSAIVCRSIVICSINGMNTIVWKGESHTVAITVKLGVFIHALGNIICWHGHVVVRSHALIRILWIHGCCIQCIHVVRGGTIVCIVQKAFH